MRSALKLLALLPLFACGGGDSPEVDDGRTLLFDTLATGLDAPIFLTSAPGDSIRLFVVEQEGTIRVLRHDSLLVTPFLDFSDSVSHGGEQGMLGLAFAPDYATSGAFYVHTTDPAGDIRVLRFKVSGDPNVADPASGVTILAFPHPEDNHNGGMLAFGNDGYLYIGSGDGGGSGDPLETGQDPTDLLGAILRIDVSGDSAGYAIPLNNPFVDEVAAPELWVYGLRNPWRFSFDRTTHDLWIGDVGQGLWEEVDIVPAGTSKQNFGWDQLEGTHCFEPSSGCVTTGKAMPEFEYSHPGGHCSVIGGYVYRGTDPGLVPIVGSYFYGDLCDGVVRVRNGGDTFTTATGSSIYSFGEDLQGRLYVLLGSGRILRLTGALFPVGVDGTLP